MIANNIKRYRAAKGLTQKELATAIGVDFSIVSKYESAKVVPPLERLQAIATVLGIDVDLLLGRTANELGGESAEVSVDADKMLLDSSLEQMLLQGTSACEVCGFQPEGIEAKRFLEIHYIDWLSQGGKPVPDNLVIVCPNCHKLIHLSSPQFEAKQLKKIAASRKA